MDDKNPKQGMNKAAGQDGPELLPYPVLEPDTTPELLETSYKTLGGSEEGTAIMRQLHNAITNRDNIAVDFLTGAGMQSVFWYADTDPVTGKPKLSPVFDGAKKPFEDAEGIRRLQDSVKNSKLFIIDSRAIYPYMVRMDETGKSLTLSDVYTEIEKPMDVSKSNVVTVDAEIDNPIDSKMQDMIEQQANEYKVWYNTNVAPYLNELVQDNLAAPGEKQYDFLKKADEGFAECVQERQIREEKREAQRKAYYKKVWDVMDENDRRQKEWEGKQAQASVNDPIAEQPQPEAPKEEQPNIAEPNKPAELNDEQKEKLAALYKSFTLGRKTFVGDMGNLSLPKAEVPEQRRQSLINQRNDLLKASSPEDLWDKLTTLEKNYRSCVTNGKKPSSDQINFLVYLGNELGKVKPEYQRQAAFDRSQNRYDYVRNTLGYTRLSLNISMAKYPELRNAAEALQSNEITTPEELATKLRVLAQKASDLIRLEKGNLRSARACGAAQEMISTIHDQLYKLDPTPMELNFGDFRKNQLEFISNTVGLDAVAPFVAEYKEIRNAEKLEADKLNKSNGVQLSEKEIAIEDQRAEKEKEKLRIFQDDVYDLKNKKVNSPEELQTKLISVESTLQGIVRKTNSPQAIESLLKLSGKLDQADPKRFENRVNAAADKASKLKAELMATKSGFRGLFVHDTKQGVAMETALKNFAEIATNRADNPSRIMPAYKLHLENLKKSVDEYLAYKKDHMNGSVADKRYALAERLRDFVEEEQNSLYGDELIAESKKVKTAEHKVVNREANPKEPEVQDIKLQNTLGDMQKRFADLKEDGPYKQILGMAIEAKGRMQSKKLPYKSTKDNIDIRKDMKILVLERQLAESQQNGKALPEELNAVLRTQEGLQKYIEQVDLGPQFQAVQNVVTPFKNSEGKLSYHANAPKMIKLFAQNNGAQKIYESCKADLKNGMDAFLHPEKKNPTVTQQIAPKPEVKVSPVKQNIVK